MASLDSLPADQKAVLSLVLQRGRTFDEIAGLLSIDRAAVRQRALEGFDALGPETTLNPLKRALITDYLLGQLPPAVADNVHRSLATHPPERAWARVIAAEVGPLAVNGLPEIPSAAATPPPANDREQGRESRDTQVGAQRSAASDAAVQSAAARRETARPARTTAAPARPSGGAPRSSRRGGAILLGLAALVIVVVVVVLVTSGGSAKKPAPSATHQATAAKTLSGTTTNGTTTTSDATPLHQINMTSPTTVKGREGAADVVRADGKLGLVLVAEGLAANTKNAYGVWLYDSKTQDSHFLGFYSQKVTATGSAKGDLEAEVALPAGATSYNELLLTLETAEKPTKPGTIVLEGAFAE